MRVTAAGGQVGEPSPILYDSPSKHGSAKANEAQGLNYLVRGSVSFLRAGGWTGAGPDTRSTQPLGAGHMFRRASHKRFESTLSTA